MSAFSSSVLLADLDYIAPSQNCILPMQQSKNNNKNKQNDDGGGNDDDAGTVMIHSRDTNNNNNIRAPAQLFEKVEITLQDCLACSGCVTSAETILITNQSRGEVERLAAFAKGNRRRDRGQEDVDVVVDDTAKKNDDDDGQQRQPQHVPFLVTLSDQSLSAAAVEWKCTFEQALRRISSFCRQVWGATHVVPLGWAQAVSCLETGAELVRRVVKQQQQQQQGEGEETSSNSNKKLLPLIVSSCPGWVCYCEKTHPSLLPLMCPVMSAQAIAGKAFKEQRGFDEKQSQQQHPQQQQNLVLSSFVPSALHQHPKGNDADAAAAAAATAHHLPPPPPPYEPARIHVSVQPCFDKKLEAVRPEFRLALTEQQQEAAKKNTMMNNDRVGGAGGGDLYTDCVLSTKELLDWIAEVERANPGVNFGGDDLPLSVDETSSVVDPSQPVFPIGSSSAKKKDDDEHEQQQQEDGNTANQVLRAAVSGGYHLAAMAALARHRGIRDFDLSQVRYTERRGNRNFRIATHPQLTSNTVAGGEQPQQLLQFALVFGFQHIQNVVRAFATTSNVAGANSSKLLPASRGAATAAAAMAGRRVARKAAGSSVSAADALNPSEFAFIEMMACPGGCTNGGGQLMQLLDPEAHKERLSAIDSVYERGFWMQQQQHGQQRSTAKATTATASARAFYGPATVPGTDAAFSLVKTEFIDRRTEFEEKLNNGEVPSLKW